MSIIEKTIRGLANGTLSKKHVLSAAVFSVALAASVGLGLVTRGFSSAAVSRDCDTNSIDYRPNNGGCGAANPAELIADIRQNDPNDLQTFYSHFGLTAANYDQFAQTAQEGVVNRDGTVVVNGQTVMTGVDTYGRKSFGNPNRKPITIGSTTYWHAAPSTSFASGVTSLPAMVFFDANGVAQIAVMNPCGNEITGTSVQNDVTCKALNKTQPDATHKPNTYDFTTTTAVAGNAVVSRVVYHFTDDNSTVTKTGADAGNQAVEHTFTKDADVTVTVYASVPGNHEIQALQVADCQKHITFVPPFYVCTNLLATAIDDQKKAFRFTVITKTDTTGQTVLQSADFTLDGKDTTKTVTIKDSDGNIYKEYTFTDDSQHTVKASVNFNTAQGVQSVSCQATVTPAKTPKCTVPGHETEAPNSPTCGYCQPNIPIGDTRCNPPQVKAASTQLVNTGPGDVVAGFVGVAVAGFIAHNIFLRRRASRQ